MSDHQRFEQQKKKKEPGFCPGGRSNNQTFLCRYKLLERTPFPCPHVFTRKTRFYSQGGNNIGNIFSALLLTPLTSLTEDLRDW